MSSGDEHMSNEESPAFNAWEYEQYLLDATDAYIKRKGLAPNEETVRRITTSMAEAGSGFARHSLGTKRVDFYKHLHLVAQLAGEEG